MTDPRDSTPDLDDRPTAPLVEAKEKKPEGVSSSRPDETNPGIAGLGSSKGVDADMAASVPSDQGSGVEGEAGGDGVGERPGAQTPGGVRVRYFGKTDVGLVREHNEDNFIVADLREGVRGLPEGTIREADIGGLGTLLAVCDGMGGAAAGEVASQMAVDTLHEFLSQFEPTTDRDIFARRLVRAVEDAGYRIFKSAKADRSRRGMGTTATVAGLMDKVLFIGQVGDSRAYLCRGNKVTLITKDQSLVNQLIEAGQLTEEEADAFEHSNIILQALGTTEEVQVDLTFLELRRGDRLMLCSDGLSGLVHPDVISEVVSETEDLIACSEKLIELANAGGGHDNITVICADFEGDGLEEPGADNPAMYQQYPLPPDVGNDEPSVPPASNTEASSAAKEPNPVAAGPGASTTAGANMDGPEQGMNWGLLMIVLVLFAVVVAVALDLGSPPSDPAPEEGETLQGVQPDETDAPEARTADGRDPLRVELRVVANVEGDLYVDGNRMGVLVDGEEVVALVAPGEHLVEARSAGSVLTSSRVVAEEPDGTDVLLSLVDEGTEGASPASAKSDSDPAPPTPSKPESAPSKPESTPAGTGAKSPSRAGAVSPAPQEKKTADSVEKPQPDAPEGDDGLPKVKKVPIPVKTPPNPPDPLPKPAPPKGGPVVP
ncbi:MAG: Stp1/IreP family PP2C-type Ser/Thr phosphatase [Myxococcales bacterium]|nr:Stp1/IreP family PP2C-type Ser/Thr phosphatase [Myxococcales bacterium]